MNLTRANLDALHTSFSASLNKGLSQAWDGWKRWCNVIPSSGGIENYPIALVLGGMREWIGPRLIAKMGGGLLAVLNRDFEHTEGVDRNDIEDDKVGFYSHLFEDMGINAGALWGKLATDALTGNGDWADGAPFFGSRKLSGKSTVNNLMSGETLTLANYETARSRMMGWTAADGTPMGLVPDLVMVGPSNEAAAKGLFTDRVKVGGVDTDNVHARECDVQVNPYLVGDKAGKWYVMCTKRGVKPVIVQQRKVGALVAYDQEHDSNVKDHNRNDYGLHYRGEAAGAMPLLVVGN